MAAPLVLFGCAQGGRGSLPDGGGTRPDASFVDGGARDGSTRFDTGGPRVDTGTGFDGGSSDRCVGVDCSAVSDACNSGVCDPATGSCVAMPLTDGTDCDSDPDDCVSEACSAGSCVSAPMADGTSCDADPADCVAEACSGGSCVPSAAVDCSPCGTGMYCGGGTCGAGVTTIAHDFEAGMPSGFSGGGSLPFVVDSSMAHGGSMAAHSGAIGNSQDSTLDVTLDFGVPYEVGFWLMTSTELDFDFLELRIDGLVQDRWSGTTGWTRVTYALAPGAHAVQWRYTKDGSLSSGSDRVWIDDITITVAAPFEGFESPTLPAGFTTSGDATWFPSTLRSRSGSWSAESGNIGDFETTSLYRTVSLAAARTIGFYTYVSTESGWDYLRFFVDGVQQDQWSGTSDWTLRNYSVGAGSHMLEWRYEKDTSLSRNDDTVWIDDFTTGEPAVGSLCGP